MYVQTVTREIHVHAVMHSKTTYMSKLNVLSTCKLTYIIIHVHVLYMYTQQLTKQTV